MEIYQFHQACKDTHPELYQHINHAIDIIYKSLHIYTANELCFSFNGGKDSTVILHLLRYVQYLKDKEQHSSPSNQNTTTTTTTDITTSSPNFLGIKLIYFDSPDNFPAVLQFMKDMENQYNFILHHVGGFHSGLVKLGKEGIKAVLMGTRKHDPDGVSLDYFTPTSLNWPPCMRICPILHWSYSSIWLFLRGINLPYCYLYKEGYTSLGSLGDSIPNPQLLRYKKISKEIINPIDLTTSITIIDEPYYLPAWELENGELERLGRINRKHTTNNTTNTTHTHTHTTNTTTNKSSFSLMDAILSTPSSSSSTTNNKPTAAIVAIGNELLNGKIIDSNISFLSTELTKQGITVSLTLTIPDNIHTIGTILYALSISYTYVFTTGGLGVTHDDNTLQGISHGFGLPLIRNNDLTILQYCMTLSRWKKYNTTTTNNNNNDITNNTTTSLSLEYMNQSLASSLTMANIPTGPDTYLLWSSSSGNNQDTTKPIITKTSTLSSSPTTNTSSIPSITDLLTIYNDEKITEILQKGYPLIQIHNVYIFPGVPAILRRKWHSYKSLFQGPKIITKELHLHSILFVFYGSELLLANLLKEFQIQYPDYEIGSYPVPHYDNYEFYRQSSSLSISPPSSPSVLAIPSNINNNSVNIHNHDLCITITCRGDNAEENCQQGITLLKSLLLEKFPSLTIE